MKTIWIKKNSQENSNAIVYKCRKKDNKIWGDAIKLHD